MRKSHNRAVIAARAAQRQAATTRQAGRPATDLTARTATLPTQTGNGPRRTRRDPATKGQGEWRTTSQNYHTPATIDSRWSHTSTLNPA